MFLFNIKNCFHKISFLPRLFALFTQILELVLLLWTQKGLRGCGNGVVMN